MKLIYIILLSLFFGFQNNKDNSDKYRNNDNFQSEIKLNNVKDSINNETDNEYYAFCCESGFSGLMEFFSKYLSPGGVKQIKDALIFYRSIESDTAMVEFYRNHLCFVSDSLNSAFYKFGMEYEYDSGEHVEWWNGYIMDCIPFMIYVFDNTIDGPTGFHNFEELHNKSKQTAGKADDAFFNMMITCYGLYPSVYMDFSSYYDQSRGYPSFGMGYYYDAMKSVIAADTISDLFNEELEHVAESILDIAESDYFAASKKMVYSEIDLLLSLKDSTRFDLSNAFKLKQFLDTTTQKVLYDCMNVDCPE